MTIYEHIGQQIKTQRNLAGLTQAKLAASIGVGSNALCQWETATRRPSIEDLYWIAHHLNIKMSELLPEENTMDEQSSELEVWDAMLKVFRHLTEMRSEQRTDRDRRIAVTITELEKVMAYFNTYIMQPRTLR